MTASYETRIRRVRQYIFDNPDGDLSLDALADVAAMSRFHWHRVFHGMTGETCAQAVRRIRAHRAACWLVQTDWPLETIAARAGYDNAQSFARTFKAQFAMTPAAFRKAGGPDPLDPDFIKGDPAMYPVEIRPAEEPIRIAALPHSGPYIEIGGSFEQVSTVFTARGLWPQGRGMIGLYYDDPDSVPEADLRSHAGIIVPEDFAMPEGLEEIRVPAQRYAVATYTGPYAGLKGCYDWFFGSWLPASGEEAAEAPCMELYMNSPQETAPQDLVTKIFMPLQPASVTAE
ncbi:AraC family transcriptional regulator [Ponticoccus sp. (in: a-proteobacteria)]|uniref:AraC family transcriptional regulator n=1 Tax=Ponticoccus sp. (in: a-proteobacteria) TaxID=1925025 RepID=UPI003AB4A474